MARSNVLLSTTSPTSTLTVGHVSSLPTPPASTSSSPNTGAAGPRRWRFIHGDYRTALPVADAHVDLLISLYAGPVSQHCTRYLHPGGFLLANTSHGDAGLAALDDRYELEAVITARAGDYRVSRAHLDSYLIPKNPRDATAEHIQRTGRGIAYTRSAFAYVFKLRSVS